MFQHINVIGILVDDLETALAFYVDVLGFEKRTDAPFGDGGRFVTVAPKGAETELALSVRTAADDHVKLMPISCAVDDVDAVCDHLRANQVEIVAGPLDEPWGARSATFKDSSGNEIYIIKV
jgi:catechol 2,3-dioxygenase-like lactoylglutathione lyase family enzyme